jgi:hypothetical protein
MCIELHRLQRDARRFSDNVMSHQQSSDDVFATDADFKFITGYPRIRRGLCPSKLRALGPGVMLLFRNLAKNAGLLTSPDIWLNAGYSVADVVDFGFGVSHLWYSGHSLFSVNLSVGVFVDKMDREMEREMGREMDRELGRDRGRRFQAQSLRRSYSSLLPIRKRFGLSETDAKEQVIYPNVLIFFSVTTPLPIPSSPKKVHARKKVGCRGFFAAGNSTERGHGVCCQYRQCECDCRACCCGRGREQSWLLRVSGGSNC